MEHYISHFNWFDISLISIIFISTIFAMFRGLIKAIFSLVTWGCSGLLTLYLYPISYSIISDKIHNDKLAMATASLGVFIAVFIILAIINSYIVYFLRKQSGGFVDRFFGICFGFARGILIVCLIFFSISLTSKMLHLGKNPDRPGPKWFAEAQTYETLDMASSALLTLAPQDMPAKLEQTVAKFKDITLSAMGEELEASSSKTKTLSDEERKLMKQIISNLSQDDLAEIYKKYDGNATTISEFERVEIFREIIAKYKNYTKENKIPTDKLILDEKIEALENSLNEGKPGAGKGNSSSQTSSDEIGYKDNNIKQIDRLIDGVK